MRMSDYDLTWHGQSRSGADSMPLGGHDAGCNVWTQDDELCITLAKSGALDENGSLLKLGRIRLWLGEKALLRCDYRQTLHLEQGCIRIRAQGISLLLWVDVTNANLHIRFHADAPQSLHLSYDCWRDQARVISGEELGQCRDYSAILSDQCPYTAVTTPDILLPEEHGALFYHRNTDGSLLLHNLLQQQGLEDCAAAIPDPLAHNTFGGCILCGDLRFEQRCRGIWDENAQTELHYSTEPLTDTEIIISQLCGAFDSTESFIDAARAACTGGISFNENAAWWRDYFSRSYIFIDPEHPGSEMWKLGRNAALFRYMLGCNAYGALPTKFNGGLFTFYEKFTPDFRAWSGSGFTAQNQRLVYWPMLKNGDFDAMKPQLDFYLHRLSVGKARCRRYYGHAGVCFPEQINTFGLSLGAEYGWNRPKTLPDGEDYSPWIRLHYSTALEFALMMVQFVRYTDTPLAPYRDFIQSVLQFYFEHYPLDEHGKLRIFPGTALETYKGAQPWSDRIEENGVLNPMDVCAGLRGLLEALIEIDGDERGHQLLQKCPPLPASDGKFLPAQTFAPAPFNCELPQLYRVFPFSPCGLTPQEKQCGIQAYWDPSLTAEQRMTVGWHQNGIFAARLGLTDEAMRICTAMFSDAPRRFPAFWGPGHDWTPDHNHGGCALTALQEMLIQTDGNRVDVLPAWDRSVDIQFKLHIPGRRTALVSCISGQVCCEIS